jgi:hypothetical protein
MTEAAMAGKSIKVIARIEERSREWVSRELASDESHHFIAELVNYHQPRILELFGKTLTVIADGLIAEKQVLYRGHPVSLGPDHSVRLTAAKRFIEIACAGRQVPLQKAVQDGLTLQELERYFEVGQVRRREQERRPLTALKAARSARRARMTEAAMAGESIKAIAQTEERSRAWVSRELVSSESHQFIAELVNYHQPRMLELFGLTVTVIDEGMKAEKQVLYEGSPVNLGPDHSVRLTASKRYLELASAGRQAPLQEIRKEGERTVEEIGSILGPGRT